MSKCFYHSADLDGKCSGAIVKMCDPFVQMIGVDYGEPFPWGLIKPDERIYMVDFTIEPVEEMLRLAEQCDLIWIDHHKSPIMAGIDFGHVKGVRQIGEAACELAWEWFRQQWKVGPMPLVVRLLGRYDVWDLSARPNILEFQYGMRCRQCDPEKNRSFWRQLFGNDPELVWAIISDGKAILKYVEQREREYAKKSVFEVDFEGCQFIACNRQFSGSKLFDSVYDPMRHDGMMVFGWQGKYWKVGLYTDKPGFDMSELAKLYGGGGHKAAAGFTCDHLPFELKGRKNAQRALQAIQTSA